MWCGKKDNWVAVTVQLVIFPILLYLCHRLLSLEQWLRYHPHHLQTPCSTKVEFLVDFLESCGNAFQFLE